MFQALQNLFYLLKFVDDTKIDLQFACLTKTYLKPMLKRIGFDFIQFKLHRSLKYLDVYYMYILRSRAYACMDCYGHVLHFDQLLKKSSICSRSRDLSHRA